MLLILVRQQIIILGPRLRRHYQSLGRWWDLRGRLLRDFLDKIAEIRRSLSFELIIVCGSLARDSLLKT